MKIFFFVEFDALRILYFLRRNVSKFPLASQRLLSKEMRAETFWCQKMCTRRDNEAKYVLPIKIPYIKCAKDDASHSERERERSIRWMAKYWKIYCIRSMCLTVYLEIIANVRWFLCNHKISFITIAVSSVSFSFQPIHFALPYTHTHNTFEHRQKMHTQHLKRTLFAEFS